MRAGSNLSGTRRGRLHLRIAQCFALVGVLTFACLAVSILGGVLPVPDGEAGPAPLANFYVSIEAPPYLTLGQLLNVSLVQQGGTGPFAYDWELVVPSPLQPPSIPANVTGFEFLPTMDGVYTVNLTATDGSGDISRASSAVDVSGPSPVAVGITTIGVGGTSLNFTAVAVGGTPPYEFLWTGPGAPSGWTSIVSWTTPSLSPGVYNVSVVARDSHGFEASHNLSVRVQSSSMSPYYLSPDGIALLIVGVAAGAGAGIWLVRRRARAR